MLSVLTATLQSTGRHSRCAGMLRAGVRLLGACVLVALFCAPAHAQRVPQTQAELKSSFAPIVKTAAPAVVNVYVQRRVRTFVSPFADDPFFRRFFGNRRFRGGIPRERMSNSLGSGVIVSPDGVVVTNNHVIEGSGEAAIRIVLSDRREFDAQVILKDKENDLAILKIDNEQEVFPTLEFADVDALEVGDLVLAIGNPFGVGQTVTSGIVSALSRSGIGRLSQQVFIQTDAAINPGNSGGALVDVDGQLVGINTAIFSRSGGSNGIGFAVPADIVRITVDAAVRGDTVRRPWLGADLEPVTRDLAGQLGLERSAGALVTRIYPGGAAEGADLVPGDVITEVDGRDVIDPRSLNYRLNVIGLGKVAALTVVRDGRPVRIDVTLREAPGADEMDVTRLKGRHALAGAVIANVTPALVQELRLRGKSGVAVLEVERRSSAARYGLRGGDLIEQLNGRRMRDVRQVNRVLDRRLNRLSAVIVRRGRRYRLVAPGIVR